MKFRSTTPFARASRALAILLLAGCTVFTAGSAWSFDHPKLGPHKSIAGAHKVDLTLLELSATILDGKATLLDVFANINVQKTDNGLVLDIVAPGLPAHLPALLGNLGAEVLHTSPRFGRVTVVVNDSQTLMALAGLDEVQGIHLTFPPRTGAGAVNGRAADAHRVNPAILQAFGVDGSGVLVGILSDSFAVTNDVRGPGTTIAPANETILTYQVPADGEYTFVVQTEAGSRVSLSWQSTDALLPIEDLPGLSAACRTRLALVGVSGAQTFQTIDFAARPDLQSFIGGSCAPDEASHFQLFGFQATEGTTLTFVARSDVQAFLSARSDCETRFNETCVEPSTDPGVPVLTNSRNQLSGDLPPTVFILQDGIPGFSDEGAAMAELIHDIAPGAAIAFHTGFTGSPAVMADGILRLADIEGYDSTVIVDDIYWYTEPIYQPGSVQQAAELVVSEGIPYFTIASNEGDGAIRQVYQGVGSGAPSEATVPSGSDLHRWPNGSGYLPVRVPPGAKVEAFLHWNQPWAAYAANPNVNASQIDLDFYLLRSPNAAGFQDALTFQATAEGRVSRTIQGRTGWPIGNALEAISYTNTSGREETLYLAVNMFAGQKGSIPQSPAAPVQFAILFNGMEPEGVVVAGVNDPSVTFDVRGPAMFGHAYSPDVMTVGAVFYLDTPEFDTTLGPTAEIDPEPFSGRGGTTVSYFTATGATRPNPVTGFKPDIVAVDGVSTTFFGGADVDLDGFPNFFGSSAAAPNAAAIAALMMNLNRNLTPAQVYTALKSTAIDVTGERAAVGRDDVTGYGLINGLDALLYVEANYGRTVGAESPSRLSFEVALGPFAWDFLAPSDFDAPGNSRTGNSLSFTSVNSINSFAWWESPEIAASPVTLSDGTRTLKGAPGSDTMLRFATDVQSNRANPEETPGTRLRVLSSNFERSSELVLNSINGAALMPKAGDTRRFRHYATLPATDSRFRLYFDLMGFDPTVPADAMVTFRNAEVLSFSASGSLFGPRPELLTFFNNNARGWTRRNASPFLGNIEGRLTAKGLELGPVSDPSRISFAYWGSPEYAPILTMERGRLYRATFRVSSNVAASAIRSLPVFRLRVNDETLQLSSVVANDARRSTSPVPAGTATVDYTVFWETPEALAGKPVHFSFDMLFVPNDAKDPNATVTLETLRVDSFMPPEIVGSN